jgi:transposase InsO family protein
MACGWHADQDMRGPKSANAIPLASVAPRGEGSWLNAASASTNCRGRTWRGTNTAHWAGEHTGLHFIPPGQPWRNGYIESFNSRVRDECLNINMFWSLAQARVVISDWKEDYRGRDRPCGRPPAQIPACAANALGS